jgi:hypothetical protein
MVGDSTFSETPDILTLYHFPDAADWSSTLAGIPAEPIPLSYTSDGTRVTVTGFEGSYAGHHLFLPATSNGCPVTAIGDNAFFDRFSLASVAIGNSVTNIGDNAFDHCFSLASVSLPNSVTDIGYGAFIYCDALTSAVIGNNVTSIGDYAFYGCPSLAAVLFTGDVPAIGDHTFDETPASLTFYYLPDADGWGATFADRPAVCWNPAFSPAAPLRLDDYAMFGFALTGNTGADLPVRIEACNSLTHPCWFTLKDIILPAGGDALPYTDLASITRPARFYRLAFPQ